MSRWLSVFLVALALGCSQPTAQITDGPVVDPDDVPITAADVVMPKSYHDAVDRIETYRVRIRDAIAAGTPTKTHRPLDELDIVLERMPFFARDSGVPKRDWETVVVASEDISELFGELHAAIDEHRTPDYNSVEREIDAAIARLDSVEPQDAPDKPVTKQ